MKLAASLLLTAVVLTGSGYSVAASANTGDLQISSSFRYDMSRALSVDIALTLTDGRPALLSFYSEGANGLRLLENVFTGSQGQYSGQLRLPSRLGQVVMVVRTAERQDTFILPVSGNSITYFE